MSEQRTVTLLARERATVHTFLFADLCGFTEYALVRGDSAAAAVAIAFHERSRALADEERCELVKSIGDAVMVHSLDCGRALRLGVRIVALGGRHGCPPVRAGIDSGSAVAHAGDWYGSTVNTAARVAAAAPAGQLIVTDRARAAAECSSPELVTRGVWHLKGLPGVLVHAPVLQAMGA